MKEPSLPLTNHDFVKEEELIKAAQLIIRNRLANLEENPNDYRTSLSRRNARKNLRKKIYQLTGKPHSSAAGSSHGSSPPIGTNPKARKLDRALINE
ncbi:unnamed protein product, partial [Brassica oleracea]